MARSSRNSNVGVVNKWGNSQGVRLPKAYCQQLGIGPGDEVRIILVDNSIVIEKKAQNATLQSRMKYWGGSTPNGREAASEQAVQKLGRGGKSRAAKQVQKSTDSRSRFENSFVSSKLDDQDDADLTYSELNAVVPEKTEALRGSETGFEGQIGISEPVSDQPTLTTQNNGQSGDIPVSRSNFKEKVKSEPETVDPSELEYVSEGSSDIRGEHEHSHEDTLNTDALKPISIEDMPARPAPAETQSTHSAPDMGFVSMDDMPSGPTQSGLQGDHSAPDTSADNTSDISQNSQSDQRNAGGIRGFFSRLFGGGE